MEAPHIKNPDGTTTWYVDDARAMVVALLGDDFDYSSVSIESLEELAEKIRQQWASISAMEPGPELTAAILRGEI